jgi:hypothetical protein
MRASLAPEFQNSLLMTLGLPPKTLAAFAPNALAWGYRGTVEIETAPFSTVHAEDNPTDISSASAPVKSLFQTDLLSIRVRANTAWAVMPGGAQSVANVEW